MAIVTNNKLSRKESLKKEETIELEQQLAKLEEDIRRLKIEFDIFFNGAVKVAPLKTKARLDSQIKRIADNRNMTFAQRYFFNTLVSRYTAYRELWRRGMKLKGEEIY